MKYSLLASVAVLVCLVADSARADLSKAELDRIGRKIWQNECGGTIDGLTSWNAGEDFASLGIGHFIWFPKGKRGPFDESFPPLIDFMKAQGETPPAFASGPCPWNSRAEFEPDLRGERLTALRKFLARTITVQTAFIVERLHKALPKMLSHAGPGEREKVRDNFQRLSGSARGAFALIDYVNFKGEGTLETERYRGEGWGLLQVLEAMKGGGDPVRDFAEAGKRVLTRRVQNSPPARGEARWLPGWKNRCASYLE